MRPSTCPPPLHPPAVAEELLMEPADVAPDGSPFVSAKKQKKNQRKENSRRRRRRRSRFFLPVGSSRATRRRTGGKLFAVHQPMERFPTIRLDVAALSSGHRNDVVVGLQKLSSETSHSLKTKRLSISSESCGTSLEGRNSFAKKKKSAKMK